MRSCATSAVHCEKNWWSNNRPMCLLGVLLASWNIAKHWNCQESCFLSCFAFSKKDMSLSCLQTCSVWAVKFVLPFLWLSGIMCASQDADPCWKPRYFLLVSTATFSASITTTTGMIKAKLLEMTSSYCIEQFMNIHYFHYFCFTYTVFFLAWILAIAWWRPRHQ